MKKVADNIPIELLIKDYLELNSTYKVASKYNVSATAVKRLLKKAGVLRTQNEAAKIRNNTVLKNIVGKYQRTEKHKENLSSMAKSRTGIQNPFYGKAHSESSKSKIGAASRHRTGERNSNYKHGKNIRRPRDFKNSEFTKLRNKTFNRDKYTCCYCKIKGGPLHAHHKIPYWVKPEAFLDIDNLITTCTECHFKKAHQLNWACFDTNLIEDTLIIKYSLNRERLNELATYAKSRSDSLNSDNK